MLLPVKFTKSFWRKIKFSQKKRWPLATFGKRLSGPVYHSQFTASNVSDIPRVELSDLENISEPAETLTIEGGQESSALMEYLNEHIKNLSIPAKIPT